MLLEHIISKNKTEENVDTLISREEDIGTGKMMRNMEKDEVLNAFCASTFIGKV